MSNETQVTDHDLRAVEHLKAASARIQAELGKVSVGQEEVVEQTLISIFTRNCCKPPSTSP